MIVPKTGGSMRTTAAVTCLESSHVWPLGKTLIIMPTHYALYTLSARLRIYARLQCILWYCKL